MNERILRVVEFDKIKNQLIQHASTELGKAKARTIAPLNERIAVEQLLNETDEAVQIYRLNEQLPFGGITDIRESVKRSTIGSSLSPAECLQISDTIRGGRLLKRGVEQIEEVPLTHLLDLSERIMPLEHLQNKINECIDDYAEVLDSASVTLRGIRSSIRMFETRMRERLQTYLRSNSNMLSDAIITIRNDRYVIPVKSEYRATVGGIVHDQSSSGQTLFMEPRSVVETNNQLQEAIGKEKQEIDKILRELTSLVSEQADYLLENILAISEIDLIAARAKLALAMEASKPKMNDVGYIDMKQARHPLIPRDEVVSNDIEIGEDYRAILITGPNTGGKTVTLKLVGLCVIMAQSGMFVPAEDGLELAVFDEVFADIGDEQSIEQSLSTFSSHMTNIVQILDKFDERSLLLFDELGAGTDPQEGAALAISILDEVIDRKATVIATTHYPELKAYGYNREQVVNASVEFDVETLRPTYRLLIGIPGRSNAFEISHRLGLGSDIIERAKMQIDEETRGIESMITSLDEARKDAESDYESAHEALLEATTLKEDLEKEWAEYEDLREKLYKKAEKKAEEAIQAARTEAEEIVRKVRKLGSQSHLKEHEWIDAKRKLDEAQPHLSKSEKQVEQVEEDRKLIVGDEVELIKLNREGTVAEVINDKEFMIEVGMMRVKAKRKDVIFVRGQKQDVEQSVVRTSGTNSYVPVELDLRGERFTEAIERVEKYVDDAVMAGHNEVTIIHGKGTGALRKGVQDYAKKHRNIASSREGDYGEGDRGVTILELK